MAGKTENIKLTWKFLMKDFDLEEPTSFLDHVYLGCTQRECTIINETCSNPEFLLEPRKNYVQELQGNLMQKSDLLGPMTWKFMQRKCVKRCCELANKTTQQLYQVATLCMDDHHLETRRWIQIHPKLRVHANKKLQKIKQERRDPQRWRSATLTSECQDCHMQL